MTNETLRLTRNILLRSFVVGVVITFALALVTISGWERWMVVATSWFHTDSATLTPMVLEFFMNARFFLLFILLTPALAIHWMLGGEKGGRKK